MEVQVADLRVSYFRSGLKSKFSRDTLSLARVVSKIIEDQRIELNTDKAREIKAKSEDEYKKFKKERFPAFTAGGTFQERSKETVQTASGLVMVDLDDVETKNLLEIANILKKDPHCALFYTSVSNEGIHILVPVRPIPTSAEAYEAAFYVAMDYYKALLGEDIGTWDYTCKDISRLSFINNDRAAIFKPQVTAIEWDPASVNIFMEEQEHGFSEEEIEEAMNLVMPSPDYNEWTAILRCLKYLGVSPERAEQWSAKGKPYREGETIEKWANLGDDNSKGMYLFNVALEKFTIEDTDIEPVESSKETYMIGTTPDSKSMTKALKLIGVEIRENFRTKQTEVRRIYHNQIVNPILTNIPMEWGPLSDNMEFRIREAIGEQCHFLRDTPKGPIPVPALFKDVDWKRVLGSYLVDYVVDPVKDWLLTLPDWDGEKRMERLFVETLDAEDTALVRHSGEMLLSAAVTRTFHPGTKYDYTIVLIGGQGKGKSTFCGELVPELEWFTDSADISLSTKDIVDSIHGALIVEFSEVRTKYADLARMKGFLTSRFDTVRLAYRRNSERIYRQWVAIATANDDGTGILPKDLTGNRRFIPIHVGENASYNSVVDFLDDNLEQLWAEAVSRYKTIPLFLSTELEKEQNMYNEQYSYRDETMERAMEVLRNHPNPEDIKYANLIDLMVEAELAEDLIRAGKDKTHQNQLASHLTEAGWLRDKNRVREAGGQVRKWRAPEGFFVNEGVENDKPGETEASKKLAHWE